MKLLEKIFGNYSDREIKRIMPIVDKIDSLEPDIKALNDDELKNKTFEFKQRLSAGETLDDILPEAFAVVREASYRVLGMRHFGVQLIGGIVLHQGRISEMKTGEGKTLVATLPAYLNALEGKGVHIVTVNDYLAKRDSEWMGKLYHFLGLSVGLVVHGLNSGQKKQAYNADITYGTNNEYGFDYLRDNMVIYKEDMVQRGLHYAIVDEVDSILIDEARTPLIISGAGDKSTVLYHKANDFVKKLKIHKIIEADDKKLDDDIEADYIVDEKAHTATLTHKGIRKAEQAFGIENLSDPENLTLSHHINQALKAHGIMKLDKDYVVKDGEVIIVDEFTGRLMFGRRYSDGLHQAIEAKEGVKVERESKTLATITFQNYFRMYTKLSGMTGTAQTEEEEFRAIYNLDVIVMPTNRPLQRMDLPDVIYKNERGKFNAVVEHIIECHQKGQPVLVGTITIEKSEELSHMLKKRGIPHEVLNAKYHEKEAEIVSQAGKKGAVTIATNMAGRGTDIVLGGNSEAMARHEMKKKGYSDYLINEATGFADTDDAEILEARKVFRELYDKFKQFTNTERDAVVAAGGLQIVGTERHESRRIDNQLRGRSGRQGDPGASRFYISLEDDLMRLFGSERIAGVVEALGLEEDQPIEHKMLSNAIENAQKKVEGRNFDIRKHVLQYDDVMNQQREVIYGQRQKVLNGEDLKSAILKSLDGIIDNMLRLYTGESPHPDDWNWTGLKEYAEGMFMPEGSLEYSREELEDLTKEDVRERLMKIALEAYEAKEQEVGSENMRELERVVMLKVVDQKWMDHIDNMDQLRQGIGLRAYGQRDPVVEYKFEGFDMFEEMIKNIQEDTVRIIYHAHIERPPERERVAEPIEASHGDGPAQPVVKGEKVGRNDPCPCGSGKKYKKCCGQ
ncbi:preprotein translocase subunit SecA [Petroclostridium sp. X23]|jgi:preprotein translocase subunit SecA|uniref:preprotein translocase subunit SecA n=1 Tax=Petroclostridium sp. X23 TaxID=3045146 RepID=UPI0024ACF59B|nr:preprotein translocase subunit SecA [Petroclostridium sp. X23]WHH57527.1 preprotein translocase subunit SecA [Petroclostridium sp. X23]